MKIGKEYYNVSDYFTKNMEVFLDLSNSFQQYRIKNVLKLKTIEPNYKVLDLGCGWGTFSFLTSYYCKHVDALDFSKKAINICLKHNKEVRRRKNIKFWLGSVVSTGFPMNTYDLVYAVDLFEHLYEDDSLKAIKEIHRILKGGRKYKREEGSVVIWSPNPRHIFEILRRHNFLLKRDVTHVHYKTKEWFEKNLISGGFKIIESKYVESHLPIFSYVEKKLMKYLPFLRRRIAIVATKSIRKRKI